MIEDLLNRLAPLLGQKRTRACWLAYLASDEDNRRRIEATLQMLAAQKLGIGPGSTTFYLAPPPAEIAATGTFLIGQVTCNGRALGDLRLTAGDINQHTLVTGRSGSGKTTALFRIIASAHENGVKTLVLDWKNEYRSLVRHHSVGADLRVFTVGKAEVSPLRFNPLIPPAGTSPSTHLKHLIDLIQDAYYLGEGVAHILQLAIDSLYDRMGVYKGSTRQCPTFSDVRTWLTEYRPKNQRESGWLSSTVRALDALCFGEMGRIVLTDRPLPMAELLAHDTVVELDVSAADKSFLVQALLWNTYAYCASREDGVARLTNLIVLEEAHNILRKVAAAAKETVTELLMRQARSRGIGIVIVDQTIGLLPVSVLSNVHNLFCLSQPSSAVAVKMLGLPEDAADYPAQLEVGQAIAKLQSRHQAPFAIRFPLEPCKEQFVADSAIREHMARYSAHPGTGSPQPAWQGQSRPAPAADEIGEKAVDLLKSIWELPHNGTVQKYRRIGVSRRRGQELRQQLIDAGLVRKATCLVPEGQVVLMEVTEKGREHLRRAGVDTSAYNPREGGAVHRYWVDRVVREYEAKGWHVAKEVPVGDRIIDVVAQHPNGSRLGIEIIRKGNSCDVVEAAL